MGTQCRRNRAVKELVEAARRKVIAGFKKSELIWVWHISDKNGAEYRVTAVELSNKGLRAP
jgi:hypothetical protein